VSISLSSRSILIATSNKWVLRSTPIPLTFLALQIVIAIFLLHLVRIFNLLDFYLPTMISWEIFKGLKWLTALNVLGLMLVPLTKVISFVH
jgi:GDP-fucose transporter C1